MMAVVLFLGGAQLLALGIIGEYLGIVYSETKSRPSYFVNEYKARRLDSPGFLPINSIHKLSKE
jgi:hypothetical protein